MIAPILVIIAGCAPPAPPAMDEDSPAEPPAEEMPFEEDIEGLAENSEDTEVRETKNVIYQGIVKPAGISIYTEGSHRLLLPDGRFILLESDGVDLNGYVNEQVELLGALRPTIEGAGTIMRVESARLVTDGDSDNLPEDEEADDSEESEDSDNDPTEVDDDEEIADDDDDAPIPGLDEEAIIGSNDDSEEKDDDIDEDMEPAEEPDETDEEPEEDSPTTPVSAELTARADKMSKESLTADNWTQEYCTAHIGFCVPIHRNWWFKSFGTTNSFLWHLELSSEELINLYDGPIQINLMSGSVGSKKATDKQVRTEGGNVIGYRSWTDSRHFEISAPAALEEAVKYITENLSEHTEN